MDDVKLALLGDSAAQERITERGELLPCPCCGGNARQNGRFFISYVSCKSCGLEMCILKENGYDCDSDALKNTIAYKVRMKWNTRAPILSAEELERLKDGNENEN